MENDVFQILNKIFTDEEFLLDNATYQKSFIFDNLMDKLNVVLNYYLATRNSSILPFSEIEYSYDKIKNNFPSKEHLNNILRDGYLTHSFNGSEKNMSKIMALII